MNRFRTWLTAAVGVVAVTAALGMGAAVMAQEGTPVPGSTGGITLLDRVATKLGIDSGTLRDAVKSSASEEADARVASGELTQEQADAMKQRIADAPDQALIGGGGRGFGGHGPHGGFASDEVAGFLGITTDELRTELQADGATLASVALAHGQTRDALKAVLTTEAQEHLDAAVAEGRITQDEADVELAERTANLDAMIDGTMPLHGPGGPGPRDGFGPRPDGAAPDVETTPSS
ncbi:MAG TPA: hypothetical protein VIH21_01800 [Dehalococcoidia bacterium]